MILRKAACLKLCGLRLGGETDKRDTETDRESDIFRRIQSLILQTHGHTPTLILATIKSRIHSGGDRRIATVWSSVRRRVLLIVGENVGFPLARQTHLRAILIATPGYADDT